MGRGDDRRGAVFRAVVPDDDGVDRFVVDRAVLFAVLAARFTVRVAVLLVGFTELLARFAVLEARRFAVDARRVVDETRAAPRDDASRASR